MTPPSLRAAALDGGGYWTPGLNETLVAVGRGFTHWGASDGGGDPPPPSPLAAYAALQSLHLDGNGLTSFDGAPSLPALRCLFLPSNALASLAGLAAVAPALATLDVSANGLTSLEGVPSSLSTLRAAHNPLPSPAALAPLAACRALTTLDVSHCGLSDGAALLAALSCLAPCLRCLYIAGNPAASTLPGGRRALLAALPELTYLDDGPVFGGERAAADGWRTGGDAGAAAATHAWRAAEAKRVAAVEGGLVVRGSGALCEAEAEDDKENVVAVAR